MSKYILRVRVPYDPYHNRDDHELAHFVLTSAKSAKLTLDHLRNIYKARLSFDLIEASDWIEIEDVLNLKLDEYETRATMKGY